MRCLGIYDANLFAGERRPPLRSLLAEQMLRYGCRLEEHELQGHPIRLFDPFSELAVPRVLLAGDAAGAEALFGEGISVALGYGKVAARAICRAFASEDFSFRDYRRRLLTSPLGLALVSRWCLATLVYSLRWRWFQFLLWRMLKPLVALVASLLVINWAKEDVGRLSGDLFDKSGGVQLALQQVSNIPLHQCLHFKPQFGSGLRLPGCGIVAALEVAQILQRLHRHRPDPR